MAKPKRRPIASSWPRWRARTADAALGQQVAMWMILCSQMDFLNTTVASDVIGNFFNAEAALAAGGGFVPKVAADGLA